MKKQIIGNWKMNGSTALLEEFATTFGAADVSDAADVIICPPSILLTDAVKAKTFAVGAQDCSQVGNGARTGELSAQMLVEADIAYAIIGHSERREYHKESHTLCAEKNKAVQEANITPIFCIGESDAEKNAGKTNDVLGEQLQALVDTGCSFENIIIAYEPVWSIGTGNIPSMGDIEGTVTWIRNWLISNAGADQAAKIPVLYGGSVKSSSSGEILALNNVDGVLVGGASLKADEFLKIAQSA